MYDFYIYIKIFIFIDVSRQAVTFKGSKVNPLYILTRKNCVCNLQDMGLKN